MAGDIVQHGLKAVVANVVGLFFDPGSTFSVASLLAALIVASAILLLRPRRAGRDIPLKVFLRVMLPPRLWRSASGRADLAFLILNGVFLSIILGGAILSASIIAELVRNGLLKIFGPASISDLNLISKRVIFTVGLFLAYEMGYWVDHYLSHRVPMLWEFHKVHHTAESLSPATTFRVHPVDSLVFGNILAIFIGAATGLLTYLVGKGAAPFTLGTSNLILVGFLFVVGHLQHSHFWIPATGPLGRLIMSPAHHQLHHSDDPQHHDSNYGSCLAIWDWVFGTLVVPGKQQPMLTFGAGPKVLINHTLLGTIALPFVNSWERLRPALKNRPLPGRSEGTSSELSREQTIPRDLA